MDYLARAMRVEEVPLLKKQYEDQLVSDKQFWDEQEEERVRTQNVFFLWGKLFIKAVNNFIISDK